MKLEFLKSDLNAIIEIPFFEGGVTAGFPSPAADFEDLKISFDKEVFGTSPSTKFCARVHGASMEKAGILNGSIVVVDRLLEPQNGKIAVCVINSEFTLKRLKIEKERIWLMPENDNFEPIPVTEEDSFIIWGIVTHSLNSY